MELEALIAHIYVVGGRTIGSPPPGALAAIAPKKAPRTRQEETFFILLIPNGSVKAQAQVYQSLAQQAAELYFQTSGGITGGLRETLTQINKRILDTQKTLMQPLRAGLICAVMREQEVYLARCGPMLAFFQRDDSLLGFPQTRTPESLNITPPLGAVMEPRVELSRFDLAAGCFLILADDSLFKTEEAALKNALQAETISNALEPLRNLIQTPLAQATIIQFIAEGTPTPITPSLPARVPLQPPAVKPEAPPVVEENTEEKEAEPLPSMSARKTIAKVLFGVAQTTNKVFAEPNSESQADEVAPSAGEEPTPTPPESPEEPNYPLLSNLLVLLALLIPLVVAVVVIGLALSQEGSTAYEVCRVDVLTLRDSARVLTPAEGATLNNENTTQAREQWEQVLEEALLCEKKKPGDTEMLLTAGEAQNNLDRFDRVVRREVTALRRFAPDADLRGPISGNWISLYTLDRTNDTVFLDVLSTDGSVLVEVSDVPVIFRGQSVGGEIVGELVDLAWIERGGLPGGNANVAVAMDSSGLLVWYNETFRENETLRLVTPPTWTTPVATTVWRLNFYVLDPGAGQVWRYVPNQGVYFNQPEEYFVGEERPDLSQALDLGIDEDGSLFVLFAQGDIKKYRGGAEQPFDLFNLPSSALGEATSLLVDNNPISRGLAVTDPFSGTLYTFSLGGTLNQGYRPLNPLDAFEGISGVLVNADLGNVYVVSGGYLYHFYR